MEPRCLLRAYASLITRLEGSYLHPRFQMVARISGAHRWTQQQHNTLPAVAARQGDDQPGGAPGAYAAVREWQLRAERKALEEDEDLGI